MQTILKSVEVFESYDHKCAATFFHILRVHYKWEMDCFILQGSVSTLFRWGGHIFSRVFVTFLPVYSNAKIIKIECVFPELWSQMYCHVFFGPQCRSTQSTRAIERVHGWVAASRCSETWRRSYIARRSAGRSSNYFLSHQRKLLIARTAVAKAPGLVGKYN